MATGGAKTGGWNGVVVTTKLKDGKGLDGWYRVAIAETSVEMHNSCIYVDIT